MVVAVKSKGTGFRGLAQYLERGSANNPKPGRIEWIEPRNLSSPDPLTAARIMRATANHNDRVAGAIAKPVEHLSISWEPGDKPSKQQMVEVADRVLAAANLSRAQALIVAHNDTDHPHVHLFINRVDPETFRVAADKHDYWPIEEVLRRAEREFGWKETPGHHWRFPDQERPQPERHPSKIERRQIEECKRPFADLVRDAARQDFKAATDWADLERRLAEKGLRLEPVGKVGFVVTDGQERCKASEIDRSAGRGALERRFGAYEQRNDRAPEWASQPDGRDRPERGGESRSPDTRDHSRDAGRYDPTRPGTDGAQPQHGRDGAQDAGRDRTPVSSGGGASPDRGDASRDSQRIPDEGTDWWRSIRRVEQPPTLNTAFDRLEMFDRLTERLERAQAEAATLANDIHKIEGKERWGERVRAEAIRQLGETYRNPEKALSRIEAEIKKHGMGRVTAKLERAPATFGRLNGWRIGFLSNGARREAERNLKQAGSEVRRWVGADRAIKAAATGKADLVQQRDQARDQVTQLCADVGSSHRWELVRDIERAAKAATPKERATLTPERLESLDRIQAEQRARFQKRNQERSQQPSKGQEKTRTGSKRAPRQRREGPSHER